MWVAGSAGVDARFRTIPIAGEPTPAVHGRPAVLALWASPPGVQTSRGGRDGVLVGSGQG